ncbi:hypothetical protein EB093_06860, partial [bacterium]|nr:hypothetical protein [bacterium]
MTIQSKWVNRIFRRQINVSLVIVGLVILTLLLFSPYIPNNIDLNVGDVAPMTVVSPRFITFQTASDRRDTEDLRRRRVALVDRVYAVDRDLNKGVLSQVVNMFTDLRRLDGHALGGNRIPDSLRFLTGSQIRYLEKLSPDALNRLEKLTVTTTEAMLLEGFREVNPSEVTLRVRTHLHDASISPDDAAMLSAIIGHVVKPNLVYSESMTRKAQLRELNTIKPVTSELKQGEPIFYKGSVVTSDNIEALKALNMYGRQMNLFKLTGLGMMAALILLLIERFIYHFNRRNHGQVKYFGLLYFVIFSVVAIARILMGVELFDGLINSYFLIPIPMAAMLVSLLVTTNISLLVCTAIAILVTSMWSGDFNVFVFLFLSAAVSTFSIYKRFSRSELMISGYIVGAFNIVLVLTVGLVREINDPFWFLANMIASFATGVISSMVTLAVVPYLEGLFSVTTQQTLLELSNLNHPLLKRLMMTAPGTYQHSLMVANLAEAAAESIQADAI